MKTIADDEIEINLDQQQAILKYMAMLKRKQNAPQVFIYPDSRDSKKLSFESEQEFITRYTSKFESLNGLKHVPVTFWQPQEAASAPVEQPKIEREIMPIKIQASAPKKAPITQDQAINRSLSVLHAMLGISAPVECAPVAQIERPWYKVAKEAKKPAKARKIPSITQPADTITHKHDVWFYLLGKDKKQKRPAA